MLAKSNLNGVPCPSDSCSPSSSTCCHNNDGVYDYLLAATKASIQWNFDKIVVDRNGHVLPNEQVLHGDALDGKLEEVIALAQPIDVVTASTKLVTFPGLSLGLLAGLSLAGSMFFLWRMGKGRETQEVPEVYMMLS